MDDGEITTTTTTTIKKKVSFLIRMKIYNFYHTRGSKLPPNLIFFLRLAFTCDRVIGNTHVELVIVCDQYEIN